MPAARHLVRCSVQVGRSEKLSCVGIVSSYIYTCLSYTIMIHSPRTPRWPNILSFKYRNARTARKTMLLCNRYRRLLCCLWIIRIYVYVVNQAWPSLYFCVDEITVLNNLRPNVTYESTITSGRILFNTVILLTQKYRLGYACRKPSRAWPFSVS